MPADEVSGLRLKEGNDSHLLSQQNGRKGLRDKKISNRDNERGEDDDDVLEK